MPHSDEFDFSQLSAPERILLAQALWDSVHSEAVATPLTTEQRAEIERRLSELKSGEVQGIPWEELKQSLLNRR